MDEMVHLYLAMPLPLLRLILGVNICRNSIYTFFMKVFYDSKPQV